MAEINWKDKCWMVVIYLVRNDGKVLLHWNKNMDTWIPIGGHIELGETPIQAVKREVSEETGFKFDFLEKPKIQGNSEIIPFFRFQIDKVPHHNKHMTFVFIGKCNKYFKKQGTDKDEKLRWFSKKEILGIRENMIESVWKVAIESINKVKSTI
jgi:8-oxo-dGTP pyrophosphatase MutT (NUDIX family)